MRGMQGMSKDLARPWAAGSNADKSIHRYLGASLNPSQRRHCKGRLHIDARATAPKPARKTAARNSSGSLPYPTTETGQGGGGGSGISSKESGGGGGDDEGDSGPSTSYDAGSILAAAGKSLESLPEDLLAALKSGRLPKDVLERYLQLESSLLSPFLGIQGFRERLLADPSFFVKLGIEIGIGMCAKGTAEYTKRGENFSNELDFVFANVMMALVADFCLVWLPSPTISFREKKVGTNFLQNNPLQRYFSTCPDNAFQKVPSGYQPFTLAQRAGAPLRNGLKLLGVGFGASLFGVGCTNALIFARQLLDSGFQPQNPPQDVFTMSAAYASYMALSSNLRYQVIAGVIEERGIEAFLGKYPRLCNLLSFAVRTGNTYLGSLMWVDYIRLLGLQKAPGVTH